MTRLTIRVDLDGGVRLGPGKVRLLELIEETGSISAAGKAMRMSYRRAWLLIDSLNQAFQRPVVAARHGGTGGGGAEVTAMGRELIERYRAIEARAERAGLDDARALVKALGAPAGSGAD